MSITVTTEKQFESDIEAFPTMYTVRQRKDCSSA